MKSSLKKYKVISPMYEYNGYDFKLCPILFRTFLFSPRSGDNVLLYE